MTDNAFRLGRENQNFERLYDVLLAAESPERIYALALDAIEKLLQPDRAFVLLPESELLSTVQRELRVGRLTDAAITMREDEGGVLGKFVLKFERPREVSEADVVAARLIAKHAEASVRRLRGRMFLALVVQELHGPLQALPAAADLLDASTPGRREQARMIEDLLRFARIQTGKIKLQMNEVDLVGVLRDAVDAAFPKAVARGTSIRFEDSPGRLVILGDGDRLRQVFWNLISNAIRFCSPNGQVEVQARTSGQYVEVNVIDDGVGIAPGVLPHMFEPFGEIHRAAGQPADEGVGLGLAIVKQFVEMHGGFLTAESAGVGKGSTFTVRLKAAVTA